MRALSRYVAALLLLGTGLIGLHNGVTEFPDGVNLGQRLVTAGVFIYGVLGVAGAVGVSLRRKWGVTLTALWGVDVTLVGAGAVAAYSDGEGGTIGIVSAFVACALITLIVWWLARRGVEMASVAEARVSQGGPGVSREKAADAE